MITVQSKKKYRPHGAPWTNTKQNYTIMAVSLPKHQYRTRTGPVCCTHNCPSVPKPGPAVKYNARTDKRRHG